MHLFFPSREPAPNKFMGTLPRSWREQNVITSVKEMGDGKELAARRELVQSKSPAQLSQITSLSEFPVPSRIQNLVKKKEPEPEPVKRRR